MNLRFLDRIAIPLHVKLFLFFREDHYRAGVQGKAVAKIELEPYISAANPKLTNPVNLVN